MKLRPQKHPESVPQEPRYYTYWLQARVGGKWKSFDVRDIFTYNQCEHLHTMNPYQVARYFESLLTERHEAQIAEYDAREWGDEEVRYSHWRKAWQLQVKAAINLFPLRESVNAKGEKPVRELIKEMMSYIK